MLYVAIACYFACALLIAWALSSHIKTLKNGTSSQIKKKQKLLRFKRGNKALTPEQNRELHIISQQNYRALLNRWKDEHL